MAGNVDPTTTPAYRMLMSELQTMQAMVKNLEIELQSKRQTIVQLETQQYDAASRFEGLMEELRGQVEDRLSHLQVCF